MKLRPPRDGRCPSDDCRKPVDWSEIMDSVDGPALVMLPCRHVIPINDEVRPTGPTKSTPNPASYARD